MPEFKATGKYLEDFTIGESLLSPGRTVTSGDIELFAEWTGDPFSSHMLGPDGRRMINTTLVVNLADALVQRMGVVEGTGYCNLGWTWTFHKPVFEGDTLWVRAKWEKKRMTKSIPGVGIIEMTVALLNQKDETVASAYWVVMILSRAKKPAWIAA
jgi:acyl dehydratase